jgi:hypothetical protein
MISEGTDGLSRGVWTSVDRLCRSSLKESRLALQGVPYNTALCHWLFQQLQLPGTTSYVHHHDYSSWKFSNISRQWTIWTPSPEVARQSNSTFLDFWVEQPDLTGDIFLVPRILQRQWENMSQYITELGIFSPHDLPRHLRYNSLIPFVILTCSPHIKRLPPDESMESAPAARGMDQWHSVQAELLCRL